MKTVAIIGGGITGLVAAYTLTQATNGTVRALIFEADQRLGGKILTLSTPEGFLIELGPDSFLSRKPAVLQLAHSLNLVDQLISTRQTGGIGSYVWYGGRLHRLPEGLVLMVPSSIGSLFSSTLLSTRGKLRAVLDLVLPRRRHGPSGDESLESLVVRRLGREVLERIAEPLIAGIHAAHPSTMSLRASFPRLLEMEDTYGSLIRGAMAARRQSTTPSLGQGHPRLSYFVSLCRGMGQLVEALTAALRKSGLVEIALGTPVQAIETDGTGYVIVTANGHHQADGAILTVPAESAAPLLAPLAPKAGSLVASFSSLAVGTYTAAFPRDAFRQPLLGHGFVIPAVAGRRILGVTYLSEKWPGRTPDDRTVLLRAFVGGTEHQEIVRQGVESVRTVARSELAELLELHLPPLLEYTHVWQPGMPQYTLGHLERVAELESLLERSQPTLRLAGASYHGIGIPDCIESGRRAAERLLGHL